MYISWYFFPRDVNFVIFFSACNLSCKKTYIEKKITTYAKISHIMRKLFRDMRYYLVNKWHIYTIVHIQHRSFCLVFVSVLLIMFLRDQESLPRSRYGTRWVTGENTVFLEEYGFCMCDLYQSAIKISDYKLILISRTKYVVCDWRPFWILGL